VKRWDWIWVTKTDLTRYVRCPYAFWLIDSGEIAFEETIDEFQAALLTQGNEFQELVEASATPVILGPEELKGLLETEITLLGTPLFENRAMHIRGRPDGLVTAGGALLPIEVQSHRDVQPLDELELAFYWLLLEPHRTRDDVEPEGRLILRRDGRPVPVSVPITADRLDRVRLLLDRIRDARRHGVLPRVCGCRVCATLRRDEVLASVTRRKDLSMIHGVGYVYSDVLQSFGYKTWEGLVDGDPATLAEHFSKEGYPNVNINVIRRWALHARSYQAQTPVLADDAYELPIGDRFLALDLEYQPAWRPGQRGAGIWLIGVCLVAGEDCEHEFLWADMPHMEAQNLRRLVALVEAHPDTPVVTWSGTSADVPMLRRAAERHGLEGHLTTLVERHVDLYAWTLSNLRLPIPRLAEKDVSSYFGVTRISDVYDGLQALLLYWQYLETRKGSIKKRLLDYNRDDVDSLIELVGRIRELAAPAEGRPRPGGRPSSQPAGVSMCDPSETVRRELLPVPRGAPRGPERRYRMLYAMYRLKGLGRKAPLDLAPTAAAAHRRALWEVRADFPDFRPTWTHHAPAARVDGPDGESGEDDEDDDWEDAWSDEDLPGFIGWTKQGTPIQDF
jgi:predicted RecB family nuclease